MKNRFLLTNARISKSRWGAYAAAGAATALAGAATVEGAVHYSGPVNFAFNADTGSLTSHRFPLEPGASLSFAFGRANVNSGAAFFDIEGNDGSFRGISSHGFRYVSNLDRQQPLSSGNFVAGGQAVAGFMAIRQGAPNSQWLPRGIGFVGFRFDVGNGTQYGWARVAMNAAPDNTFTLLDYAWADPGQRLRAGQKKSRQLATSGSLPRQGSLGLLAVGAAGLVAWRKRRSPALQ